MREILEPPQKSPEVRKQEKSEETYWKAVDSFIAITEGAKEYASLQTIVDRLKRHIDEYLLRINTAVRVHERMLKTNSFDREKSTQLEKAQREVHNYIIEDINELFRQFQEYGLDSSWRKSISEADDLGSDEHRAEVTDWATHVETYLLKKRGQAA